MVKSKTRLLRQEQASVQPVLNLCDQHIFLWSTRKLQSKNFESDGNLKNLRMESTAMPVIIMAGRRFLKLQLAAIHAVEVRIS